MEQVRREINQKLVCWDCDNPKIKIWYSETGDREITINGLCETCFDNFFENKDFSEEEWGNSSDEDCEHSSDEEWGIGEYFSEKELSLIKRLSPDRYQRLLKKELNPYSLFKLIAEDSFKEGKTGDDVESLRRIVNKFKKCKGYSNREYFDDLIS